MKMLHADLGDLAVPASCDYVQVEYCGMGGRDSHGHFVSFCTPLLIGSLGSVLTIIRTHPA